MQITLEQIDLIRKRTNAGYMQAKQALEMSNGDVVEALAYIEQSGGGANKKFADPQGFIEKVKQLIHKGNISKFVISKDGKSILNIPVNVMIVVSMLAIHLVIISTIAALIFGCKFSIDTSALRKPQNADIVPLSKAYNTQEMKADLRKDTDNTQL